MARSLKIKLPGPRNGLAVVTMSSRSGGANAGMIARRGTRPSAVTIVTSALVVVALLAGCGLLPEETGSQDHPTGSQDPPTPTPMLTFRDEARGICQGNANALRGLADRLAGEVTAANLVEQGTIVAGLAGVISAELQQLRAISLEPEPSDREAAAAWLEELGATVDAQVRAVAASARRELSAFQTAVATSLAHWEAAGRHALAIRLSTCRLPNLDGSS